MPCGRFSNRLPADDPHAQIFSFCEVSVKRGKRGSRVAQPEEKRDHLIFEADGGIAIAIGLRLAKTTERPPRISFKCAQIGQSCAEIRIRRVQPKLVKVCVGLIRKGLHRGLC